MLNILALTRSSKRTLATFTASKKQIKTGIVLFNLGGPKDSTQVEPFLRRLFSDPDLIPLPWQSFLAPLIAKRRTPKIIEQYKAIGGGSPILKWTRMQGDLLCEMLDKKSPSTAPHKAYIAFRYTEPLTEECLDEMRKDGVERAVAFTQYPQYSCSTTGSSLNELSKHVTPKDLKMKWSFIDRWPTHPGLIKAFVHNIQSKVKEAYSDSDQDLTLLFSAHSLPMSVVNRGDTYPAEVAATVYAIMQALDFKYPYRLVWQSQVGPSPWLGPRTDKALEGLAKKGIKNVMLVPVAFTSDHVETLFELDLEYGEHAKQLGITGLTRCDSLNTTPLFIEAMRDVVMEHMKEYKRHSVQLTQSCPGCDKDSCRNMRQFVCQK